MKKNNIEGILDDIETGVNNILYDIRTARNMTHKESWEYNTMLMLRLLEELLCPVCEKDCVTCDLTRISRELKENG